MVADFGFREAIASDDVPTIESTLLNHGERADATLLMLSNLEHEVIAATPASLANTMLSDRKVRVINEALNEDTLHFLRLAIDIDVPETKIISPKAPSSKLFQLVSTNIASPLPIATLTLGHVIDDKLALDLKSVTDMELLFFSKKNQQWVLHAGSLQDTDALQLLPPSADFSIYPTTISKRRYLAMPIQLSNDSVNEVIAIAAKPLDKLMMPFNAIELMFLYLLIASIFLSVVAIYIVTHKMVRPLNDFAHMDNLTNIGNRRLFNTIVDNAFISLNARNKPFAVLMLDLNEFKQINDIYGHDAGDMVLIEIAKRIKHVMRNSDNVVRLGGDEFAIIVHDGSRAGLTLIANKVYETIATPIQIDEHIVAVTASIGIVIAPLDANNKASLMKFADSAMYVSKTKQLPYYFFDDQSLDFESKPSAT